MQIVLYIQKQIVESKMQRKRLIKDKNLKADRTCTFQDFWVDRKGQFNIFF